jgi:hypothetical protein
VISDEAVEAAARNLYATFAPYSWESLLPSRQNIWRNQTRLALEAAAPFIAAQAWDEGFKQGGPMHDVNMDDPDAHTRNPYRSG